MTSFPRSGLVPLLVSFSLIFLSLFAFAGCDCSDGKTPLAMCETTADCEAGQRCIDGMCEVIPDGAMDSGVPSDSARPDTGPPPCTDDSECGGGVCLEGSCCPSSDLVCGSACCAAGDTCFANACVVPGAMCRSTDDCGADEYCEVGLADPTPPGTDGGVPTPDGGVCLGDAPAEGRCLALPPRCADGMAPGPGEACIRDCEYRPPVGNLDAVEQWAFDSTTAESYTGRLDVWSTPVVGRLADTNCDGVVDEFDPPNVIFVSGNAQGTYCSNGTIPNMCKTGVLRVLDGPSGRELWSSRRPEAGSLGFTGVSPAIGDLDHDGDMEVVAIDGEGYVRIVDHTGVTIGKSDRVIPGFAANNGTGWGGGISIADMDHDGNPEIAYGRTVFTTDGTTITRLWEGAGDWGRGLNQAISVFVNLDADPELELLAGRTAYGTDGTVEWSRTDIGSGFSAIGDFDGDGTPEVPYVSGGRIYLLNGADGTDVMASIASTSASPGNGGPPTVADFDGDGRPEIGVAFRQDYMVVRANYTTMSLELVWAAPNHDLSSSVTGSTVFDFEGDGAAEVIYNDECFLWVYDGATGAVRFATPTTSFTATEASLVADIDSDGSAEIVMVANGADPSSSGWGCDVAPWTSPAAPGDPDFGRPAWVGSDGASAAYRGLKVFRARDNSWVGTRSLWNQHAYSVSNICGDRGDACTPPSTYGDIPTTQVDNWSVGFLNNFRQNIQGEGIFDAPDATVSLSIVCTNPLGLEAALRNLGAAVLPAGVTVGFFVVEAGVETEIGRATTATPLFPGQTDVLLHEAVGYDETNTFKARILIDPSMPTFQECDDTNNESAEVMASCLG